MGTMKSNLELGLAVLLSCTLIMLEQAEGTPLKLSISIRLATSNSIRPINDTALSPETIRLRERHRTFLRLTGSPPPEVPPNPPAPSLKNRRIIDDRGVANYECP